MKLVVDKLFMMRWITQFPVALVVTTGVLQNTSYALNVLECLTTEDWLIVRAARLTANHLKSGRTLEIREVLQITSS